MQGCTRDIDVASTFDVAATSVPDAGIRSLDDLPPDVWERTGKPADGYHFTTVLHAGADAVSTLLDGGAVFSLTWEATLVYIINSAPRQGLTPDSVEWPIAGLYDWGSDSSASSVNGSGDLAIRGEVDLRLGAHGIDGQKALQVFRFRLLRGDY